MLKNQVVK